MLLSFALILLLGMIAGELCKKIKLPALIGMLIVGIVIGPYMLNLIDETVLDISADIRKIALILILTRAGLTLNVKDLKKVGRPAVLMSFVPACFEIVAVVLFAPAFLQMNRIDALILGSVLAAVSPAVVVPSMLKLIDEKRGTRQGIPQMILASASIDDVFVIALFTSFLFLAQSGQFLWTEILYVPISIMLGAIAGIAVGYCLRIVFGKLKLNDMMKVILVLSLSFLLVALEETLHFSSLIGVMTIGMTLRIQDESLSQEIAQSYSKMWSFGEIFLFVLVGASVNLAYAVHVGGIALVFIVCCLLVRMIGVYCCLIKTKFTRKERLFIMLAYTPKATVQAAIGGIPLAMGLSCGEIVLSIAVLSILISAPLGSLLIEKSSRRLLLLEDECDSRLSLSNE